MSTATVTFICLDTSASFQRKTYFTVCDAFWLKQDYVTRYQYWGFYMVRKSAFKAVKWGIVYWNRPILCNTMLLLAKSSFQKNEFKFCIIFSLCCCASLFIHWPRPWHTSFAQLQWLVNTQLTMSTSSLASEAFFPQNMYSFNLHTESTLIPIFKQSKYWTNNQ